MQRDPSPPSPPPPPVAEATSPPRANSVIDYRSSFPRPSPRFRRIVTALLAAAGVQAWLLITHGFWGRNAHLWLLLAALAAGAIPPVRDAAWAVLRRVRRPSPRARAGTAVVVAVIAAGVLARYAIASRRDLFPTMHDELQFLVQARMLASGRLWLPPHPLVDFFDTFYVLITPKYAAQGFPGAAMVFVPAVWFHIAPWKLAIVITAAAAALLYRVVAELVDGLAGLLAASMFVTLPMVRYVSTMVLPHAPLMLLGLALTWAYLRWRRAQPNRAGCWAAAIGFFAAAGAITRPVDSLMFALPVAAGVLWDLRNRPRGFALRTIGAAALAAAPVLALQLTFDYGVTGRLLKTPFSLYNDRDQPRLAFGLHPPPDDRPPLTRVIEKQQYYRAGVIPRIVNHRPGLFWQSFVGERLPVTIESTLPQPMLTALLPAAVMAAARRRAWVLATGLPLFFLLYVPYPLFAGHYPVVAAPSAVFAAVLGFVALAAAWPRARRAIWTAAAVFTFGLAFTPDVDVIQMVGVLAFHNHVLAAATEKLAALPRKPAVVLFTRDPKLALDTEPVYNYETPWPDDAAVVRAHDRGPENETIFNYYAKHGPDRAFYRFDEARPDDPLTYLGMASELASKSTPRP